MFTTIKRKNPECELNGYIAGLLLIRYGLIVDLHNILACSTYKFNSERSDECIDFTMIITSRNNAPISNFGGGFRCKSEYPWCIMEVKS
ncbi:Uncharacterized protein FWK35_00025774 [Aphis craccivora]|uniref:Uncharacterized protein n=1 Tax=Aphis craccivora TaxID=307492 RepID=A0A6G0YSL0_APHCR|nr:Uncharacterized protein FWK35_00025774 [Aphis craccivora]